VEFLVLLGHYALTPAYNTTVVCADGGTVQLKSRERPQLLLRNGTPTVRLGVDVKAIQMPLSIFYMSHHL
jgi:hypothetical protein